MSDALKKEEEIKQSIHKTFKSAEVEIKRAGRLSVKLRSDLLPPMISYLKDYLMFKHLVMISCVDWMEENEFELVYHVYSYEEKIHVMIKVRLDREKPEMQTLLPFWEHAATYEREIHEMHGVFFEGNPDLGEFILEDWDDIPPMRRDFHRVEYVNNLYEWREGREDKQDVRTTIAEKYGETIPEFSKEEK
jgi:NADH-quinone oxidoreductase subunit C